MNKRKWLAVTCVAAIVGISAFVAFNVKNGAPDQDLASTQGVINPDSAGAGLSTEPLPEPSQQKIKPLPSMGVGSYTEPAAKKPKDKKSEETASPDSAGPGR